MQLLQPKYLLLLHGVKLVVFAISVTATYTFSADSMSGTF